MHRRLSYCTTAIRHLSLYCINDRVSCTIDGIYRGTYKKVSTYSLPHSVINLSNLTSLCLKYDIGSLIPVQCSLFDGLAEDDFCLKWCRVSSSYDLLSSVLKNSPMLRSITIDNVVGENEPDQKYLVPGRVLDISRLLYQCRST